MLLKRIFVFAQFTFGNCLLNHKKLNPPIYEKQNIFHAMVAGVRRDGHDPGAGRVNLVGAG